MEMTLLKNVKEVQILMGWVAALNRFVSKATDKCLSFFKTFTQAFEWTEEFQESKGVLDETTILEPVNKRGRPFFCIL